MDPRDLGPSDPYDEPIRAVMYKFKPKHPAKEIQKFIQLCQRSKRPMRYGYNHESDLMWIAVLCCAADKDSPSKLHDEVKVAGISFENVETPSQEDLGAAKSILLDWDVEIRQGTVVVTNGEQFEIFSPEGAHLW